MASNVSERRKSPRIDARLALQVEKKVKGGAERPATTESLNLSSGGLYCQVRSHLTPMTKVGLTLLLPSFGRQGKKTQVINCEGVVVRCEADESDPENYELACCFTDVRKDDRLLIEEYIGWRLMRDLIDERLSAPDVGTNRKEITMQCHFRRLSFAPVTVLLVAGFLCTTLATPTFAVDKFGAEFLKIGVGSRALGMGGSFVALADDASAGYWNPAGLSLLPAQDLQITHAEMFGGILKHDVVSWGMPIGDGDSRATIGVTAIRLSVDDIKVTRDALVEESGGLVRLDPSRVRLESAYDLGLMFSYARGVGDRWSMGGTFKLIRQSLVDEGSSFGLGADLGFLFLPNASTSFGLRLADITTTQISWDTGRNETVAPTVTLGAQTTRAVAALRGVLTVGVDIQTAFEDLGDADQFSSGSLSGNVLPGLEYWYNRTVALRVGSNAGHFAAGAGLRFNVGPFERFGVDYAFLDHDELDTTNRVTLNLGW